jgi:hypothetical protein
VDLKANPLDHGARVINEIDDGGPAGLLPDPGQNAGIARFFHSIFSLNSLAILAGSAPLPIRPSVTYMLASPIVNPLVTGAGQGLSVRSWRLVRRRRGDLTGVEDRSNRRGRVAVYVGAGSPLEQSKASGRVRFGCPLASSRINFS